MTVYELIIKDFKEAFPSVLANSGVEMNSEDIVESSTSNIIQELSNLEGNKGIIETERKNLLEFIELMDDAETLLDFDEDINQGLQYYIEVYPGIQSFEFCHLMYRIMHITDGGISRNKVFDLYKSILDNHSELIPLEDFIEKSNFHVPILLIENPSIELIELFQIYNARFPKKAMMKSLLSRLYEASGNIEKSIEYNHKFLGQLETDKVYNKSLDKSEFVGDSITIEDFHLALNTMVRLYYLNMDLSRVHLYSQKCLYEYKIHNEGIHSFQVLFMDPITYSMRAFIKENDINGFRQYYELLISKTDHQEFEELNIPDIKEYAANLESS